MFGKNPVKNREKYKDTYFSYFFADIWNFLHEPSKAKSDFHLTHSWSAALSQFFANNLF